MNGPLKNTELTFENGEEMYPNSGYQIISKPGTNGSHVAEPLGRGGAGHVFLATYKNAMQRAVKFLDPPDSKVGHQQRFELFERTFEREIAILSGITHTNIAKILDFGEIERSGHTYKYFAMEYIAGSPLTKAWSDRDLSGRRFLKLMGDIFGSIKYLHDRGILHSDIKGENILFRKDGAEFSPMLLDLGVAKVVRQGRLEATLPISHDEDTYFFSSRELMWPAWGDRLGRTISQSELEEMFPAHDIYSLGKLLDKALRSQALLVALSADLHADGVEALQVIRERLLESPTDPYYADMESLQRDWEKLDAKYLAPLGVAELAIAAHFKHSIPTPSGRVIITEGLAPIISHEMFQRLRDIPQLEFAHMIFPGAKHSRLLHALSTFDVARQYVAHLLNEPSFRLMVSPTDIQAALLWALLHDLGHFPLSHMFEDFSEQQARDSNGVEIPTDDDLFWSIVDPDRSKPREIKAMIQEVLRERRDVMWEHERSRWSLARTIREGFSSATLEAMEGIGAVLQGGARHATPSHCIIAGILSSAIDVDKVAYLQDDSTMTGIRYGQGIDLDALLGSLRVPRPEEIDNRHPVIAINDKGLSAAESVAVARYWMLKRVYWHHTNRAIMAMVKFVIASLLEADRLDMVDYLRQVLFGTETDAVGYLSNAFRNAAGSGALGTKHTHIVNTLIGLQPGYRALYKRILTIAPGTSSSDRYLYRRLEGTPYSELLEVAQEIADRLEEELGLPDRLSAGEVLVDIPYKEREGIGGKLGGQVYVYPRSSSGTVQPLEQYSPVLESLREQFDQHIKKFRVFVHPRVHALISPQLRVAQDVAREVLEERAGGRRRGGLG